MTPVARGGQERIDAHLAFGIAAMIAFAVPSVDARPSNITGSTTFISGTR
jgi:hypothetical protein